MTERPDAADTSDGLKADARPTRAFFVQMLTRDISLEDCILDLIDNSIDAAWKSSGQTPSGLTTDSSMAAFSIRVELSESRFSITDNCGGLPIEEAKNNAFTFGRRGETLEALAQPGRPYSVGVYGIGMKRSIFKLGKEIRITSTFVDGETTAAFVVPITVPTWMDETSDEWDFPIESSPPLAEPGLSIMVDDLTPAAAESFRDPGFASELRKLLARDYLLPLLRGLELWVGDTRVLQNPPEFRHGEGIEPMRDTYEDDEVRIEIIAGMVMSPPDENAPEQSASPNTWYRDSGWYVVCNGRIILPADRSSLTVWGRDGFPQWHAQYMGFVGLVFFSSRDPRKLPMNTTKRNVDTTSDLYKRAVVKMYQPTREWIDYTNDRKEDLPSSKELESRTLSFTIVDVPVRQTISLPRANSNPATQAVSLQFSVPLEKSRKLAEAFGDRWLSNREVGRKAFDYAFDDLVGDDDE